MQPDYFEMWILRSAPSETYGEYLESALRTEFAPEQNQLLNQLLNIGQDRQITYYNSLQGIGQMPEAMSRLQQQADTHLKQTEMAIQNLQNQLQNQIRNTAAYPGLRELFRGVLGGGL